MIVTTTHQLEGKKIEQYLGIVVGEAVMGANIFKDIFASIRDIVGGRSGAYEDELTKARKIGFQELEQEARSIGANAVIGVDIAENLWETTCTCKRLVQVFRTLAKIGQNH